MYWIHGKYSSVRLQQESDADNLVAWRNRPDAARWLVQWEPLTMDVHLAWFRRVRDHALLLVFEDRSTRLANGASNFYNFDRLGNSVEWVGLLSDGKPGGLLEACFLCHRILFELLGFERTYSGTAEPNTASRRCAEFIGYKQEGLRRSHLAAPHGIYNVVEYGLLAAEFQERTAYLTKFFYAGKEAPEFTDEARQVAAEYRRQWFNK
jgi:RimJ/RimL family protein N-acetyltransferase